METITILPIILAVILAALAYGIVAFLLKGTSPKSTKLQALASAGQENFPISAYNPIAHIQRTLEPEMKIEGFEDESTLELVEDESSIFLKEAESVIDEITQVIANIASRPANPAEVFTKIRAIVSQYGIFQNTEFYDAINRYVAVSVERELALRFTEAELTELWS